MKAIPFTKHIYDVFLGDGWYNWVRWDIKSQKVIKTSIKISSKTLLELKKWNVNSLI